MRSAPRLICSLTLWKALLLVLAGVAVFSTEGFSQNPGSPVVYNVTINNGVPQVTPVYSNAYIDASASSLTGNDFCAKLHSALLQLANATKYTGLAGVIDARGVSLTNSCTSTDGNPWNGITVPSTVLLPSGTIKSVTTWVLPPETRLIGEGGEDPGLNDATIGRTIIQAQSSFSPTANPMIKMGTGLPCTGVSIEDLVLDGGSTPLDINGIDNPYCTDRSYVNHVTIYRIVDYGLNVYTNNDPLQFNAANSGPYSNITFDTATATASSNTFGAYLGFSTRGIQGMTCTTGSATVSTATCVNVAASGNSVEDVRIEGFSTGVTVAASDTVLMNIDGDTNPKATKLVVDVVTIGSGVTGVALLAVSNNCTVALCSTDTADLTIKDSATNTNLQVSTDPYVAMYVLGNKLGTGTTVPHSRYTTSPTVANWSSGTNQSPANGGACTGRGSLYSYLSSGGLYVCSAKDLTWVKAQ